MIASDAVRTKPKSKISVQSQQNRYTRQSASVSEPVSRKAKWLQTVIVILIMLPLYLDCLAIESSEQRKASGGHKNA